MLFLRYNFNMQFTVINKVTMLKERRAQREMEITREDEILKCSPINLIRTLPCS